MTEIPAVEAIAFGTAQKAIALLIDLAQRGEINPWDVQVIEVIDRYLSELSLGNDSDPGRRDADLSESGQAFLWASMLVLLKADTLEPQEEPEVLELTDAEEASDDNGQTRLPLHLERYIHRRLAAPPRKKRPVTLPELISQLQQMATQLGEEPLRTRVRVPRALSRSQASSTIAHLAHDENLTEIASRLEALISRNWQQLSGGKDWLNLDQLLEWWTLLSVASDEAIPQSLGEVSGELDSYADNAPGDAPSGALRDTAHQAGVSVSAQASQVAAVEPTEGRVHDRVGVFWALLLLSAQSKVELSQEEFYQDLKIRALE
ncbi:MAG: segregation/condensation protein A [Potamolinea sp.]